MMRTWIIPALCALVLISTCTMARADDKPSAMFCWVARGAVKVAGSEKAAEDKARAKGVSEAIITKAKRCPHSA
jgi:hypothetical protein